ncbi:unnamed protein product, partial [Linum tenue]
FSSLHREDASSLPAACPDSSLPPALNGESFPLHQSISFSLLPTPRRPQRSTRATPPLSAISSPTSFPTRRQPQSSVDVPPPPAIVPRRCSSADQSTSSQQPLLFLPSDQADGETYGSSWWTWRTRCPYCCDCSSWWETYDSSRLWWCDCFCSDPGSWWADRMSTCSNY